MSPEEALALEHQTRYSRLKRFVQGYNIYPAPEFHDYVVPAERMPVSFRHDVPVLRIVFPENTFFATASDKILPSAYPIIQAMAKMLDGDVPDVNVFIAGHTDSRGTEDYNHNLSIQRSRAVSAALERARTQFYPLWSIGFGESLPLYPNTSDSNMAYNRRVEFLLGARPEAVADWLRHQYDIVCQTNDPVAKLSCLTGLKETRRAFVAEPQPAHKLVQPTSPRTIRSETDARRLPSYVSPQRMVIQLDEHRLHVQDIEH